MMFSHQTTGSHPPVHSHPHPHPHPHQHHANDTSEQDPQGRRHKNKYNSSRHSRGPHPSSSSFPPRTPQPDPFHGLDKAPVPAAFTRPPMVRDTDDVDMAVCHMRPNSALPESQVHGVVLMLQKRNSKTLFLNPMLSGFRPAQPMSLPSADVRGPQLQQHGLHVHEKADFSNGCDSTGPHYNPKHELHGGPHSTVRHIGDFGNVASDQEGAMNMLIMDQVASLRGEFSILGKPLVIHAQMDDLGSNPNDPGSTSTGNSGARLACCLIERVPQERTSVAAVLQHRSPYQDEEEEAEYSQDPETHLRQLGQLGGLDPQEIDNL